MGAQTKKLIGVVAVVAVAGVLIGFYISGYLVGNTPSYQPPAQAGAVPSVNLTLQTVAAVGPTLAPNPNWVSYPGPEQGRGLGAEHVWRLPAHALVHVTIYNFDGASGLRNPFLGRPTGLVGPELVDGKPLVVMPPDQPSHTFAVPRSASLVPVEPVGDDEKNQCD